MLMFLPFIIEYTIGTKNSDNAFNFNASKWMWVKASRSTEPKSIGF